VEVTLAQLQEIGSSGFPGLLGIDFEQAAPGSVHARLQLEEKHMAPNGYVHAGAVVGLADTACGYGCFLNLPEGATGFTTIEVKTNFLRSAQPGETIACEAKLVHGGRTTQLWDATVSDPDGRPMALFRATQLMLR
jgi:uncharacterized protein (TIGR00369 family)